MENKHLIKVGFLISYDYKYIEYSLPRIYSYADYIVFAIDKDRKTWSGEEFEIPDSFFEDIKNYDTEKKVHIYEDSFYIPALSPIECDTRERNMLAKFMGKGGWHLQIDSDEYFLNFEEVVSYIRSLDISCEAQIFAKWITMYKKENNEYFLINTNENFPFCTNKPDYITARLSNSENDIYTDFKVLHQSWARDDQEIIKKISNWGHSTDFDTKAYYNFWKAINKHTYKYARSFHPLDAWLWPSLEYFEAKDINELTEKVSAFLKENEKIKMQNEKIKPRDLIPPVLYKLKAKISGKR